MAGPQGPIGATGPAGNGAVIKIHRDAMRIEKNFVPGPTDTLCSTTVTTYGKPLQIRASIASDISSGIGYSFPMVGVTLTRDGQDLAPGVPFAAALPLEYTGAFDWVDAPSAGEHTYAIVGTGVRMNYSMTFTCFFMLTEIDATVTGLGIP